ncbi:MAG: nucleotidyltransferase domain-containing protein [Chlamydiales bacterium]
MEYDEEHQNILNTAVQILQQKIPRLVAVIAFGSFGTKYEREDSDLDLAILTEEVQSSIDIVRLWDIAQDIARTIDLDVDLINLRSASTVFCYQILTTGSVIFCSNQLILAHFDTLIISMYLRLQEDRKDILDDYEKGIFYA